MMDDLSRNKHAEFLSAENNLKFPPMRINGRSNPDESDALFSEASSLQHHSIVSVDLNGIAQQQQPSSIFMPWPFSNSSSDQSSSLKLYDLTPKNSSVSKPPEFRHDVDMMTVMQPDADSSSEWSVVAPWTIDNSSETLQFAATTFSSVDDDTAAPVWYIDDDGDSRQEQFAGLPYDWAHAPAQVIFIGFILCALTVLTVLGNIYVITAVMIVRRLRRPDNLLIVSLATADLLVGLIDMPFAIVYQLKGRWIFSQTICDLWISFDVLVCTASILNLCMISIDRYLAISRPLHYGIQGRTRRKMAWYIACVWCVAVLISIPPLFFFGGNEYIANKKCGYSPSIYYQLYATLGAFYIPLLTTLIVYGQVYRLASRVARAERRSLGTVTVTPSHFQEQLPARLLGVPPSHPEHVHIQASEVRNSTRWWFFKWFFRQNNPIVSTATNNKKRFNSQSSTTTPPQSISPTDSHASSSNVAMRSTVITPDLPANGFAKHHHRFTSTTTTTISTHPPPLLRINRNNSSNSAAGAGQKFIKRERKAMRTLSAITAAFVMCWLPFFILALLAPICSACKEWIPPWLSSTTLWLGYCNSFINPFLYAYFNRDFRTPFRAIMCCQCHRLHSDLRVEQFRAQYGSTTAGGGGAMGAASTTAAFTDRSESLRRGGNTSRHGSSVKVYHQHHRGSRETVQTASGSQNGSFRHQRSYAAEQQMRNGSSGGGGLDSSTQPPSIELTSVSTAHDGKSDERLRESLVGLHNRRKSSNAKSGSVATSNLALQFDKTNGSVVVVIDGKPSAAGLEATTYQQQDEQLKHKRSKHRKHRHRRNTSEIAINTDITGAMIESYVANKRQQQAVFAPPIGSKALLYNQPDDGMSRQSEDNSSRKSSARRASSQRTTVSGSGYEEETL